MFLVSVLMHMWMQNQTAKQMFTILNIKHKISFQIVRFVIVHILQICSHSHNSVPKIFPIRMYRFLTVDLYLIVHSNDNVQSVQFELWDVNVYSKKSIQLLFQIERSTFNCLTPSNSQQHILTNLRLFDIVIWKKKYQMSFENIPKYQSQITFHPQWSYFNGSHSLLW